MRYTNNPTGTKHRSGQIHGEAIGVFRLAGGTHLVEVEASPSQRSSVLAKRIVIAIGSPPQKSLYSGVGIKTFDPEAHTYIEDMYLPSEEATIHRMQNSLSRRIGKELANVLIIGSNASALEMLYLIRHRPELKSLVQSVVVISRTGLLPYRVCDQRLEFDLNALETLAQADRFGAADLMAAIASDIRRAQEAQLNIADLRDPVGAAVSRLTALMSLSEQERFVCEHGINYSRMMRRAGRDTRDAAEELASSGVLTTIKGEFRGLLPSPEGMGLVLAAYSAGDSAAEVTHPRPFSVTINCGGFQELDHTSSPLIKSLVENKICFVNRTKRGFLINDRLQASENVYVIGPLLAGNFNDKVRLWHVESASRIAALSKILAESLFDSLFAVCKRPELDIQWRTADHAQGTNANFRPVPLAGGSVESTPFSRKGSAHR